jgi:signal transduction histidine kinase
MYASFDKALRSQLESAATYPMTYYTEYLDLMRFPDESQQEKLTDFLRVKYASRSIDLIVVVSPLALKFVIKNGDALFPETPIVFASVNIRTLNSLSLRPNITGIAVTRNIPDTLDLAVRLQPDTTQVIVPVGTSPLERSWAADLRNSLHPYEDHLTITFLSDLPMDELLAQLRNLPPHTIVLFSQFLFYDGAGRYFLPEEALDLISQASNSPVYGTDSTFLGNGIVGGHLYDLTKVGVEAGKIGRRILSGENPADIPVQTLDPNFDMFDARQLRRWSISQSRLPSGSILRFSQPSFWELYRRYVLACLAVFLLQTLLVVALIAQARRLKESQSKLRGLSRHLINTQEEERKRIARELHDDFSQRLAVLRVEIGSLAEEQSSQHLFGRARLSKLCIVLDDLCEDIRHLSHSLHSSQLQYLGLQAALKDLCRQVQKGHSISVEFQADELTAPVPAEIALCFYRVAQEALNNAVKHSGASEIVVSVSSRNGKVRMRITDSGRGFDTSGAQKGLGLASMYERVLLVNGELLVSSTRGGGTELIAQVALAETVPQSIAS